MKTLIALSVLGFSALTLPAQAQSPCPLTGIVGLEAVIIGSDPNASPRIIGKYEPILQECGGLTNPYPDLPFDLPTVNLEIVPRAVIQTDNPWIHMAPNLGL